ncbi:MAG TPA: hypothetical protein VHG10_13670 [Glycomyces sp.]|nr:hypothetical protein [Glycomyces sp.]
MARGHAGGRAEGRAETLQKFLAARGVELSKEQRERIETCDDERLIDVWIFRAATAQEASDVFDPHTA